MMMSTRIASCMLAALCLASCAIVLTTALPHQTAQAIGLQRAASTLGHVTDQKQQASRKYAPCQSDDGACRRVSGEGTADERVTTSEEFDWAPDQLSLAFKKNTVQQACCPIGDSMTIQNNDVPQCSGTRSCKGPSVKVVAKAKAKEEAAKVKAKADADAKIKAAATPPVATPLTTSRAADGDKTANATTPTTAAAATGVSVIYKNPGCTGEVVKTTPFTVGGCSAEGPASGMVSLAHSLRIHVYAFSLLTCSNARFFAFLLVLGVQPRW